MKKYLVVDMIYKCFNLLASDLRHICIIPDVKIYTNYFRDKMFLNV